MGLRVIGAGLGRTGTNSLKLALERLLGGTCHHMFEVMSDEGQASRWEAAARGEQVDWLDLMSPYTAAVDWPSAAFWPELTSAFPDALVLLSIRDLDRWFDSASATIFVPSDPLQVDDPLSKMWAALTEHRFVTDLSDRRLVTEAAARHNSEVLAGVDRSKLLVWSPGDGWEPICAALGLDVPDEPFPHVNSTAEFQARRR